MGTSHVPALEIQNFNGFNLMPPRTLSLSPEHLDSIDIDPISPELQIEHLSSESLIAVPLCSNFDISPEPLCSVEPTNLINDLVFNHDMLFSTLRTITMTVAADIAFNECEY